MAPMSRKNAVVLVCLLSVSCGGAGRPDIAFDLAPGWEEYVAESNIVRLRKAGSEATIDLGVQALGRSRTRGSKISPAITGSSRVSAPSVVTEEADVTIGGVAGKRIAFEGKRPDTGVPTAGLHHLLDGGSKAYDFLYLGAGPDIDVTRAEAKT
jgi:hypothetical protein